MIYFWRLVYLYLKYIVITNFVDPGYSRSRDPSDPKRRSAMGCHVGVQLVATVILLRLNEVFLLTVILLLEGGFIVVCTWMECKVSAIGVIRAYIAAEVIMVITYTVIVYLTSVV